MSVRVMSRVWQLRREALGATEKLVLLKLADCADDDGANAFPSVRTLAEQCCMSVRATQYVLHRLRDAGLIEVQEEAQPGAYRPTTYRVVLGTRGAEAAPLRGAPSAPDSPASRAGERGAGRAPLRGATRDRRGVQSATGRGATRDRRGVQPVAPRSVSTDPSNDPSIRTVPPSCPPALRGEERARRVLSGSRRKRDRDAFRALPLEEQLQMTRRRIFGGGRREAS